MAVARAPGKLVVTGAYAVLEGATSIVAAVDRYATADSGRPPTRVTEEVAAAITAGYLDGALDFDASPLRAPRPTAGAASSASGRAAPSWSPRSAPRAHLGLDEAALRASVFRGRAGRPQVGSGRRQRRRRRGERVRRRPFGAYRRQRAHRRTSCAARRARIRRLCGAGGRLDAGPRRCGARAPEPRRSGIRRGARRGGRRGPRRARSDQRRRVRRCARAASSRPSRAWFGGCSAHRPRRDRAARVTRAR